MSLTVNADDFGISPEVNRAIALAFRENLINRTTMMTNMPFAKEAMELAEKEGFADRVGIHLNLTSGMPLSEGIRHNPVMCGENGEFTADFARNLKTRFFFDRRTRRDVYSEILAQFEKYSDLGGKLWHVDSHHHVHTDPSVWFCLLKVLKKYPVTGVRLGRNLYTGGNRLMRIYKSMYNASVRRFCKVRPDYFGSALDMKAWMSGKSSGFAEDFLQENNVEIMVHPVFDSDGHLMDINEREQLVGLDEALYYLKG